MTYLHVLVALFGALTLLNLLLTFGVIRRLRERPANTIVATPGFPAPGTLIGDFTSRDLDGRPVSRSELSGRTLVGFFSPGCDACRDRLPDFVSAAASFGPQRSLAIVMSDAASASDYLPSLTPAARVVLDDPDGPLISAFAITAFPSFFVVGDGGRIVAGGVTLTGLPVAAVA
jgi:thiol-disulfide isomerase/thioredoxin